MTEPDFDMPADATAEINYWRPKVQAYDDDELLSLFDSQTRRFIMSGVDQGFPENLMMSMTDISLSYMRSELERRLRHTRLGVPKDHDSDEYAVPTGLETPITDYSPEALRHMTSQQIRRLPVHLGAGRRLRLEAWMKRCGGCLRGERCGVCQPYYDALTREKAAQTD